MYCIVWRHYNSKGITPYPISKFPCEDDVIRQPELADKLVPRTALRQMATNKSLGSPADMTDLGKFYDEQLAIGNVIVNKIIDIDYNTMEDILVFKDKQASQLYLKFLDTQRWTVNESEIVLEKEIKELKELPAFQ